VVITSNSEKTLPDAFLRRCIYYDIPFPAPGRLMSILAAHLRRWLDGQGSELVRDAVRLLLAIRAARLRKEPSTAELIGFGRALRARGYDPGARLAGRNDWQEVATVTLFKTQDDREAAAAILTSVDWRASLPG
jgi:MoxR-like ATPase